MLFLLFIEKTGKQIMCMLLCILFISIAVREKIHLKLNCDGFESHKPVYPRPIYVPITDHQMNYHILW